MTDQTPGPDEMDWTYLALRAENAALRADLAAYDTVISKLRAEVERLRDLIVRHYRTSLSGGAIRDEALAILAARQKEKK